MFKNIFFDIIFGFIGGSILFILDLLSGNKLNFENYIVSSIVFSIILIVNDFRMSRKMVR